MVGDDDAAEGMNSKRRLEALSGDRDPYIFLFECQINSQHSITSLEWRTEALMYRITNVKRYFIMQCAFKSIR